MKEIEKLLAVNERDPVERMRPTVGQIQWEPYTKKPEEKANVIWRAEMKFPIIYPAETPVHANNMRRGMKQLYKEVYDRLETLAYEIPRDCRLKVTDPWIEAADKMADLYYKYLIGEQYRKYIGTEPPKEGTGYGSKVIFISAMAVITKRPEGEYLSFVGTADAAAQDPENYLHYNHVEHLESIL